jgi:lipopolysaccharide transport system ATP-binding protein
VRTKDGEITDTVDIRQPVGIEIEYEVLKPDYALWPHFTLHNDEGIRVFVSFDLNSTWRGRPRPAGRYASTGWIPGNFLSEGMMIIGPAMRTEEPKILHFYERDAVAFQVVDSLDGDSARGDYGGRMRGVVRPLLEWDTRYGPHERESVPVAIGAVNAGDDQV